jgi:adenine/guanine phosphoribosyltransferase-like PRPP-binding protein
VPPVVPRKRPCGKRPQAVKTIPGAKSPWHQEKSSDAPSQAIRDFGVKLKLNPVRYLLQGKRIVLVDDSIVRGTTSRKIVRMVRQA